MEFVAKPCPDAINSRHHLLPHKEKGGWSLDWYFARSKHAVPHKFKNASMFHYYAGNASSHRPLNTFFLFFERNHFLILPLFLINWYLNTELSVGERKDDFAQWDNKRSLLILPPFPLLFILAPCAKSNFWWSLEDIKEEKLRKNKTRFCIDSHSNGGYYNWNLCRCTCLAVRTSTYLWVDQALHTYPVHIECDNFPRLWNLWNDWWPHLDSVCVEWYKWQQWQGLKQKWCF